MKTSTFFILLLLLAVPFVAVAAPDYSAFNECLQNGAHAGDVQYCEMNFPPVDDGTGTRTNNPPLPVSEIIPCGEIGADGKLNECKFNDLLKLFENVVRYVTVNIIIPAATISFAYFGFKLVMNGDNPSVRTEARKGLMKVAIGLVVIVAAWLIVKFIVDALLNDATKDAVRLINF